MSDASSNWDSYFSAARGVSFDEARSCIENGWGFDVDEHDCWLWRARTSSGYGPYASFWGALFDEVPQDKEIVHKCDGGPVGCVNPGHLEAVSFGVARRREMSRRLTPKQRDAWSRVIEAERIERGWSKARMARELGVTTETIRSWCKGLTMPPPKLRRGVAGKLGWELEPTKFVVQFVYQEVVVAESQVHAIRAARSSLPTGAGRKAEYLSVKKV